MLSQSTTPRLCSVDGCDRRAEKRGWCTAHYKRWRRWGDPLGAMEPTWVDGKKRCSRCRAFRDPSEFGKNAATYDGLNVYCIGCWPIKQAEWRAANLDKARASNNAAKKRKYRITGSCYPSPLHEAAYRAVHEALRKGTLIRPSECSRCGKPCKPDAHHPDHREVLTVVWLCKKCHAQEPKHPVAAQSPG